MGLIKFSLKSLLIYLFLSFFSLANNSELTNSDVLFKQATDFVKSKKYDEAILIFEKLAKNSEHDAQYNLAVILKAGKGKTKKYTDSLYWAYLSKLGNISEADDLVSELIDLVPEKTVETIREEVKVYLEKSIENGSETSIMQLGKFFLEIVNEKEYPSAYKWFTVGAALGLENAIEMRDEVEEELSPEEIIEEQDNAEKFFNNFVSKRDQNSKEENNS
ncbi:MAG: hypothetical protein CML72_05515 [Rhodobacterales bacterium]|nr:hypothetical protein [Rhodobacterales bacterium]